MSRWRERAVLAETLEVNLRAERDSWRERAVRAEKDLNYYIHAYQHAESSRHALEQELAEAKRLLDEAISQQPHAVNPPRRCLCRWCKIRRFLAPKVEETPLGGGPAIATFAGMSPHAPTVARPLVGGEAGTGERPCDENCDGCPSCWPIAHILPPPVHESARPSEPCSHLWFLADTCYGMTGGDLYLCRRSCGSRVVTRPNATPPKDGPSVGD